jgi:phosphoglycolate phosphatase
MMSATPPGGVIFDLDGTLLDTLDDIAAAMNTVLRRHGQAELSTAAYRQVVGGGIDGMVKRALPGLAFSDDEIADYVAEYRREYDARWREHSRPYPGVAEMLRELERRGVRKAVLSNKSHPFTVAMTDALLGGFRFDKVLGATAEAPLKPDPTAALEIAAAWSLEPARVIFMGDSDIDMRTAVAAGMPGAGALWGFRTEDELRANGAAILLDAPGDLLSLF